MVDGKLWSDAGSKLGLLEQFGLLESSQGPPVRTALIASEVAPPVT